jgi:hypothetical protein
MARIAVASTAVREIRLYDTRTRTLRPLEPREPG